MNEPGRIFAALDESPEAVARAVSESWRAIVSKQQTTQQERVYGGRDAIFGVTDIEVEDLYVTQWKTWVRIRGLTAAERDDYEQSVQTGKGKNRDVDLRGARVKLVIRSVVDEQDKPIFNQGDFLALSNKSGAAIDAIFDVAARLSGITDKDVEELAGN